MEVQTTPWYETRSLVAPQIEMLSSDGMIQWKDSYLKDESPKTTMPQKRFIHYNVNYVKYCFLKEFYQLLFDGARQGMFKEEGNEEGNDELCTFLNDVVTNFVYYCREQSSEENARELFRSFCKAQLYN